MMTQTTAVSIDETRFKYTLNHKSTTTKLKERATTTPMELLDTLDNSHSIQFSTGAFVTVVCDLVKAWKGTIGMTIATKFTDGMDVSVTSVTEGKDQAGHITQHVTRLVVEGEPVTITTFDTTVRMVVQGGPLQEEYCTRALLPYLTTQVEEAATSINHHNEFFRNLPVSTTTHNKRRPRGGVAESVSCTLCDERF